MKCPGLHCPGCRDGGGKVIVIVGGIAAGMLAAEWVAAHAWEVLAVTAACGALAVAAVVALMRWADRRDARHAAEHPFLVARDAAALTATVTPQVTQETTRPAIVNNYYIRIDPASREAARIIRTAIPGQSGDAITEGN